MRVTILRRLVPAAALLVLLFLAAPIDAASVTYEDEYVTEMVYRGGQRPFIRNSRVRRVHHVRRHYRAGSQIGYNTGVTSISDNTFAVPDGGSTLAMMFASTALLLLGYHRLGRKRVAA